MILLKIGISNASFFKVAIVRLDAINPFIPILVCSLGLFLMLMIPFYLRQIFILPIRQFDSFLRIIRLRLRTY